MRNINNKNGGNYTYWIPEILKISNIYKIDKKKENETIKKRHNFWDFYKRINTISYLKDGETYLSMIELNYTKNSKKYIQWNHYPNMIIDLDWFRLNQKKIYNIIITEKTND